MAAFKDVDPTIQKLAQYNDSFARKAMGGEVKQSDAARLLGCAPSVISDYKDDSLLRACQVLAAFNVKFVHKDEKTWPPSEIAALRVFARKGMDHDPESDWGALT